MKFLQGLGHAAGPHKVMVHVKTKAGEKLLAVEPNMYDFLIRKFKNDETDQVDEVDEAAGGDTLKNDESKYFIAHCV